jgi:hypothetical protein
MELFEFFKDHLGTGIGLFIGGLIKWLFDKWNPKEKADVKTTEIDNGSKVVDLYKEALDDLPIRYKKELNDQEEIWTKKVILLEQRFDNLDANSKEKERIFREEIDFLKRERDLWKRKYNELYREYQKYKNEHP